MNRLQAAEQLRKALQMFAAGLSDAQAMEVAAVYDPWKAGKVYATGDFLTYGKNSVGDPQLYRAAQAHTAQADWKPDTVPALYTPIGLDASGYPIWAQPAGAHDAYQAGDLVVFNSVLYQSLIDGNDHSPAVRPEDWAQAEI